MSEWNRSGLNFTDISAEEFREYQFADGGTVRFDNPTWLHVSPSGGHRLVTADGRGHYIPAGFRTISWQPKAGQPIFVA